MKNIPGWGQTPVSWKEETLGMRQSSRVQHHHWSYQNVLMVPPPNQCQGFAQPFPTAGRSAQLRLDILERADNFGTDAVTSDPQLFPWQKLGPH